MTVVVGAVVGLLAGRLLWVGLRPTFTGHPGLLRDNHRGRPVPTAVGVVLAVAVVVVEAGRVLAGSAGIGDEGGPSAARLAVLVVALGLGLLGAIDDLVGDGDRRGFRGHLGALAAGRLTTGAVKLVGGAAVAVLAVAVVAPPGAGTGRLLGDAALVALAANLANLLDRAPGRTGKAGLAAFAVLAVATGAPSALAAVAVVAGAAAALLLDDLRERLMLGDAGANVLGGALGLGAVVACAPATRTAALVVVAVLNVASEVVSFSRVIDAVPPLRALDRAGRRP
ncbi:MAG TPA: hypothetical protein VM264_04095 [Acidimicrobiales bacterium]|nr:hypothetical protein [Acidimicrobiales bacterium]